MDGPSSGPVASGSGQAPPVVPTKRTYTDRSRQEDGPEAGPSRQCKCRETPVQRTVVKEGPNTGRAFWVCQKPQDTDGRCDYFEWDDESPRSIIGAPATNANQGGQTNGECFKCHQEGHWASACPNDGGASKRSRSFGSKADNLPSGSSSPCFKCGQEGHWSNACPNGDSGSTAQMSMASNSRGPKRGRGSTRARGRKTMSKRSGKTKKNTFGAPDE
ncbi:hypothetical protein PILCRDRAFT_438526 [Piloderma croceum F 1598]|uniref:CCHC-type domain-containing protein n=1 Tax=Piloderma croceum (strain F 1598) TaxID=765440 RepID=A0A0C3FFT4_PILCF|nr:hypothetical protein PILCRDRAFT_438526 [Piloderma croceum F 1598]